jgi:integrase
MSIWTDKNGRKHVGLMVGGQRVHRILPKEATARDAKRIESQIRESLERDKSVNIPGNPLISEVMTLYIAHAKNLRSPATAKYHAERAGPWAEKYRASQARQFAAELISDMTGPYAAATINRTLGTVKKALRMAWELGRTPEDFGQQIKRLPENNARDVYLTREQVAKIASHASPAVASAIWIALYTGARRGEVLAMQPQDVGPDFITIHASNTKTLKTRAAPITEALRPHLAALPLPLNFEGLKTGFRRAREAAKMEHVNFHDLRHSCAAILIASGTDIYTVSKVLGHSSVKTTERYAHQDVSKQTEALKKAFDSGRIAPTITPGKKKGSPKAPHVIGG